MLPYFRSAGCHNYARYAAFYVHHMKGLDPVMMKKLQYGAFVCHIPGIYNSTWTDMFIETTYIRLWHGQTGEIGLATDYHHMAKWALSFALRGGITDQGDRQRLCDTLDVCIDPLNYASHPDGALMNIVTGHIAHLDVNADNAVSIGHRAMENFKGGCPDSEYCPLGKLVVTMDVKKNHVLVCRNVSITRNSSTHVSLVYWYEHERSNSMMFWPLS